jgi:hypothetical protein
MNLWVNNEDNFLNQLDDLNDRVDDLNDRVLGSLEFMRFHL